MYRCRRFVAVLLSLALVASVFVITVSADNESFGNFLIYTVTNGTGRYITLSEGSGWVTPYTPGTTINFTISRISSNDGVYSNIPVLVTFDLYVYHAGQNAMDLNSYPTINTTNSKIRYFYPADEWLYNDNLNIDYNYDPVAFRCEFLCHPLQNDYTPIYDATWSYTIRNNFPNETPRWGYVIRNLVITPAHTWIYNYFFNFFSITLTSIENSVQTFYNTLCNQSVFTVDLIRYDADGNASIYTNDFTWHQAIYQLLHSLNAPVVQQVQQEQKAKEAGALDALDSAYDKADDKLSFWSFLDLIDIGDIGSYDDDALEDAGEDSIIDWFSNACKNDIEGQVINPPVRDPDNEIVDFYHDNLDSILDYFGGGS